MLDISAETHVYTEALKAAAGAMFTPDQTATKRKDAGTAVFSFAKQAVVNFRGVRGENPSSNSD